MDEECPYCEGTGLAPGDGRTKCGFCDKGKALQSNTERVATLLAAGRRLRPSRGAHKRGV